MKLYRIMTPVRDNSGNICPRDGFYGELLALAGGYTVNGQSEDVRIDEVDDRVYREPMIAVDVVYGGKITDLIYVFSRAFPDQLCAMIAVIGEARFFDRRSV